MNPSVSVVIPCYNHENYIEQRIQSILRQTVPVAEIVFLDDASTDRSVAIAQGLLDRSGFKTRSKVNLLNSGHVFKQWNQGVSMCSGEFVWIAESDDFCEDNFLEACLSLLMSDGQCVLAYARTSVVDQGSRVVSSSDEWGGVFEDYPWHRTFTKDGLSFVKDWMTVRNVIPNASGVVFRRESYISAGLAPEYLFMCGDWLLWGRIILQGSVGYAASTRNFFRRHSGNVHTGCGIDIVREHIEVECALLDALPQRFLRPERWQRRQILKDLLERGLGDRNFGYWLTHPRLACLLCWLVGKRGLRVLATAFVREFSIH